MDKVRVGISVGDINGVGLEVMIKALSHPKMLELCTPIIYGSSKIVSYHKNIVDPKNFHFSVIHDATSLQSNKINVLSCWTETVTIQLGMPTEESGKYAHIALDKACNDLKSGAIDALVTAPINKKAMSLTNFAHPGHTEYLEEFFGQKNDSLMLMIHDQLRVGLVTTHIPVSAISSVLTDDLVIKKLQTFMDSLMKDFGLEKPHIAVLGLNPHASDNGLFGNEEQEIIIPALQKFRNKGYLLGGPFAADGFFGSQEYLKYDGVLAMYHDQGLIPFKTLSFGDGVNYTAGLSVVRTSPDHGTAYAIAGQNKANPSSFKKAIFTAIDIVNSRKQFDQWNRSPLQRLTYQDDVENQAEA